MRAFMVRPVRFARHLRAEAWVLATLAIGACGSEDRAASAPGSATGDPQAGARIVADLGCGMCHAIPGIAGARGGVGPDLAAFAQRRYFAGSQPNQPERLLQWILDPPSLSPSTAMPPMPIDADQARDVVAFLYSLR